MNTAANMLVCILVAALRDCLSILDDLSFRSLTSLCSGKHVFFFINVAKDEPLTQR